MQLFEYFFFYIKNYIYKKTPIFFKFTVYPAFSFPTFLEKCRFCIFVSYRKRLPFQFSCNLGLKNPFRNFNGLHFGHISSKAKSDARVLKKAQSSLQNQPNCVELHGMVVELRKRARFLKEAERSFFL